MTKIYRVPEPKTIVIIGMMGVGKTSVGKRLAKRLGLGFADSDHEAETASGLTVADIYDTYGEDAFHELERKVILRLLDEPPHVLSTGGGAFMSNSIRKAIQKKAISVWIKADMTTLLPRLSRRSHRPQFKNRNQQEVLENLIRDYYPVYAEADIVVDCDGCPPDETVDRIVAEIEKYMAGDDRNHNPHSNDDYE